MKSESRNAGLKEEVGIAAAGLVEDGMTIGIGTGSTMAYFIKEIGRRVKNEGLKIRGVATSYQSRILCYDLGIPLMDTGMVDHIDLAVDGADEIDSNLNAIKGGGAAHTIEKIVAAMARRYVLIGDESKIVKDLGLEFPIPIEVIPEAMGLVYKRTKTIGADPRLRMAVRKDGPVVSDNGNFIVDLYFEEPLNIPETDVFLHSIPGIVETGLFIGMAEQALIAGRNGVTTLLPQHS